jgi:DNA-binding MarR family transcriptional regulator
MPRTPMPTRDQPASSARAQRARRPAGTAAETDDFQHDSLGYALRRAQVRAYDLYFAMLGDMDLTPARVTALSLIAMQPDITQADLARKLDIAGPSALKVVDALEEGGLVRREGVAGDRRRYSLLLTDEGRARMDALRVALAGYEQRLAKGLSAAERRQLMDLLGRVAA